MEKILFIMVLCGFSMAGVAGIDKTVKSDFYSESQYLDREDIIANSNRIRLMHINKKRYSPYLHIGSETYSVSGIHNKVDTLSHFSIGPGVKLQLPLFLMLAEIRFKEFHGEKTDTQNDAENIDARLYLVAGHDFQKRMFFSELYSELLFSSADENNLINNSFVRGGFRFGKIKHALIDLYLENFIALDTNGHFYNNKIDWKGNIRLKKSVSNLSLSLTYSYFFNKYLFDDHNNSNPYKNDNWGHRVLFVMGGVF